MTYIEIIYLILLVLLPIALLVITESGDAFLGGFVIMLMIGLFIGMVSAASNDFKITSKFETYPTHIKLDNDKLHVITDEYKHFEFSDYATIQKYKNGCKFYKVYFYKQWFGLDDEKMELIIE